MPKIPNPATVQKWNMSPNINYKSKTLSVSTRSRWESMPAADKSRTHSTGSTTESDNDCVNFNEHSVHYMFDIWHQKIRYSTSETVTIRSECKI